MVITEEVAEAATAMAAEAEATTEEVAVAASEEVEVVDSLAKEEALVMPLFSQTNVSELRR